MGKFGIEGVKRHWLSFSNRLFTFLITIWAIFGHYHTRDDVSNSTRSLVDLSDSNKIDYLLPMAEDELGGLLVMEGCEKE